MPARQEPDTDTSHSQTSQMAAEERLDTVGFFCPIPIIKTAAKIRSMRSGAVLEVLSDDRVILIDMPNWCRSTGHEYLGHHEEGKEIHLFVRKR
jgi:TusA-related sulfurtransferase